MHAMTKGATSAVQCIVHRRLAQGVVTHWDEKFGHGYVALKWTDGGETAPALSTNNQPPTAAPSVPFFRMMPLYGSPLSASQSKQIFVHHSFLKRQEGLPMSKSRALVHPGMAVEVLLEHSVRAPLERVVCVTAAAGHPFVSIPKQQPVKFFRAPR